MTPRDTILKARINGNSEKNHEFLRIIDDDYTANSKETPLRVDAFDLDDQAKINKIALHFQKIVETLGLDLNDR